jgi:hypothetical protein
MASIVYTAILFVFIFGAGLTYINDTGLYEQRMPDSGITTSTENANQTGQVMLHEAEHPSTFSTWNQLGMMFHAIWGGIVALFTIGFLLESFGIPPGLVGFLISPLAIIVVFWLAEYFLGRPAE